MPQKIFRSLLMAPLALMLLASTAAEAARIEPIYTPDPIEIPAGKSGEEVKLGIRKALFSLDFKTKEIGPGQLEATHIKNSRDRVHTAVLSIQYDSKTVRIRYKDSKDLNYNSKTGEIHGTYNRWVRNVEKRIRGNLGSY